jgi:ureidoacrylate peracid hydrolase
LTTKALILVDYENEWTDKNSEYYVGDLSELIIRTNKLIDFCRKKNYKIIFTTHIEKESKEAFAPGSKNVEIIKTLDCKKSDILIRKNKISPFYKTNLEKELKGINEIVIAGILTNLCVRSLAQDAYDRDYKITIIDDCCKAFDNKTHNFTLKDLKFTRPEINILNLVKFIGLKKQ